MAPFTGRQRVAVRGAPDLGDFTDNIVVREPTACLRVRRQRFLQRTESHERKLPPQRFSNEVLSWHAGVCNGLA